MSNDIIMGGFMNNEMLLCKKLKINLMEYFKKIDYVVTASFKVPHGVPMAIGIGVILLQANMITIKGS